MKCQSMLCVFQHDDICNLPDEVVLDWRGSCTDYCPIDLGDRELQTAKRALIGEYESEEFIKAYDAKYRR